MGLFGKPAPLVALVVDDEVELRTLLGMFVQGMGFDVVEAGSGEHAVQLAEERRPALILLDIMLPGLTGYDVLTLVRGKEWAKDTAILMCTAKRGLEDVERCLDGGADDYLQKPFDTATLKTKIMRVLEKRGRKLVL